MMRNTLLFFITSLIFSYSLCAQAPQAFNYQGVARDLSGTPLATKNISVKASILDGSAIGSAVYSETHSISTNQFGLFTLPIGAGNATNGIFATVNWGIGSKFLKIEIDPNGGSNYTLSGTTQLLSVPYAMYAANSGNGGSSQWINNSNGIVYPNNKVGIGTENGNAWFSIEKSASGADRTFTRIYNTSDAQDANTASYWYAGTGTNNAYLDITVNSKGYFPQLGNGGQGLVRSEKLVLTSQPMTNPADGYVSIFTGSTWDGLNTGSERLRVTHDGKVGIGTIAPTALLHTNGSVRFQNLTSNNSLTTALVTDANGNLYTKDISTLGGTSQWTNVTGGINYSGGRVGIGTSAPVTKLHIEGALTGSEANAIELVNNYTGNFCGVALSNSSTKTNRGGLMMMDYGFNSTTQYAAAGKLTLNSYSTKGVRIEAWNQTGEIEFTTGGTYGVTPSSTKMLIKTDGNVGIGTIVPTATLHTNGTVRFEALTSNASLTNALVTDANGNVYTRDLTTLGGTSQWTNVTGGISYVTGKVGIGTTNPGALLSLERKAGYDERGFLNLVNTDDSEYSSVFSGAFTGTGTNQTHFIISTFANSYYPTDFLKEKTGATFLESDKLVLASNTSDGYIAFRSGVNPDPRMGTGIEKARIDALGNLGIGTKTPKAKLHISSGDVYIDDSTKGIIMKNSAGQCYRITVGTAGALISTLLTACP